jgi:hypothetical protein
VTPPLRSLLVFALGLALGAGAAWLLPQRTPAPLNSSSRPTTPATSLPPPAPALLLPPLLAPAEADEALAAYLALPPLAKDAPAPELAERLARLQALLTLLPDTHLPPLLSALATRTGGPEGRLRRLAFDIWVERDAPAAAHWALALTPGEALNAPTRSRLIVHATLAWARADFPAAWDWTRQLTDPALKKSLLPPLLAHLSASDPDQALSLAAASADDETRGLAELAIFDALAKTDPATALRRLGPILLTRRGIDWQVRGALVRWISQDPASAIDWALAQPPPHDDPHRALLAQIVWELPNTPAAVRPFLDVLARRDDIPFKDEAIRNLVGTWINQDAPAALAYLDTIPDTARRSEALARALAYLQPKAFDQLLALARRLPASEERDHLVSEHLATWVKKDPDAALAWLAANPHPALAAASAHVEAILVGQLAATDPQAALARWQALPADAPRAQISTELATAWAKNDPVAATRWFTDQISSSPGASPHFGDLAQVAAPWVAKDPAAYAEWALSQPEGPRRNQALSALTADYLRYWLYARPEAESPPRAAHADNLSRIADPSLREAALHTHLFHWVRSDRRAARAWLESTDALSPEAVARLLTLDESSR